jgi:hypothetical protein
MYEILKPWVLVVGRKRYPMSKPMRLEIGADVEYLRAHQEDMTPTIAFLRSESIRLLIGDKLFSTVIVIPKRRYSRSALRLIKPKSSSSLIEVRLTKKLNRLVTDYEKLL